jgi:FAD dependent oxidoreductase central domain
MCASGTAAAGGVGKYLTEWIMHGESSVNLWAFDVQRFVDLHNNKKFLCERVVETFG